MFDEHAAHDKKLMSLMLLRDTCKGSAFFFVEKSIIGFQHNSFNHFSIWIERNS